MSSVKVAVDSLRHLVEEIFIHVLRQVNGCLKARLLGFVLKLNTFLGGVRDVDGIKDMGGWMGRGNGQDHGSRRLT